MANNNSMKQGSATGGAIPYNKSAVYNNAKIVWDLSKQAWYPERYSEVFGRFWMNSRMGVKGFLNLEQGYYLMISSCGQEENTGDKPALELMAVRGIDEKTSNNINDYLANSGLKYTPFKNDVAQDVREISDESQVELGSVKTTEEVLRKVDKKIMGYVKKRNLPLLYLRSNLESGLGSLDVIGIGEGNEPNTFSISDWLYFKDGNVPQQTIDQIIGKIYGPLLTAAIPALEKEVQRIEALRKQDHMEELVIQKIAQRILNYPIK